LHGDLWFGNYIAAIDGTPYLIDPAISYGHREFDLAMSTLFGGFDDDFYRSYHNTFPLQAGWKDRELIYQLYQLLNHYNLFGGEYFGQVKAILDALMQLR